MRPAAVHYRDDPSYSPAGHDLFRLARQFCGDALAALLGMDRKPVDQSAPSVKCRDDGSDNLPIDLRDEKRGVLSFENPRNVFDGAGNTGMGIRCLPEF